MQHVPEVRIVPATQRSLAELAKLIRKLRWIGMETKLIV